MRRYHEEYHISKYLGELGFLCPLFFFIRVADGTAVAIEFRYSEEAVIFNLGHGRPTLLKWAKSGCLKFVPVVTWHGDDRDLSPLVDRSTP